MPAARVLNDLDERVEIDVEILRIDARRGVDRPGQRTSRRRIDFPFESLVQSAKRESLEIGALPALHVEHLNVFAGLHLVANRFAGLHVDVLQRFRERVGRSELRRFRARIRPADVKGQAGRRILLPGQHGRSRRGNDQQAVGLRDERRHVSGSGSLAQRLDGVSRAQVESGCRQSREHSQSGIGPVGQHSEGIRRSAMPGGADHGRVRNALRRKKHQFRRLKTFQIQHGELVALTDPHRSRSAARNRVTLNAPRKNRKAGSDHAASLVGRFENRSYVHQSIPNAFFRADDQRKIR